MHARGSVLTVALSAVGGFLGGSVAAGAVAAALCYPMLADAARSGARSDSVTNGVIPMAASLLFSLLAVGGGALLGGVALSVGTAIGARRTGRIPVLAYAGYALSLFAAVGYAVLRLAG